MADDTEEEIPIPRSLLLLALLGASLAKAPVAYGELGPRV